MSPIRVHYHREPDGWWADSPDVEGFVAAGSELGEVRDLVKEGLPLYLARERVEITETGPGSVGVVVDLRLDNQRSTAVSVESRSSAVTGVFKIRQSSRLMLVGGARTTTRSGERVVSR